MQVRERYNDFIQGLEILNICLKEVKYVRGFLLDREKYPIVNISLLPKNPKFIQKKNSNNLKINFKIEFRLDQRKTKKEKPKNIFKLEAIYEVDYEVQKPMDESVFEIFMTNNIPLNIHPYIRHLVQDSMLKVGLPPLILPVIKKVGKHNL